MKQQPATNYHSHNLEGHLSQLHPKLLKQQKQQQQQQQQQQTCGKHQARQPHKLMANNLNSNQNLLPLAETNSFQRKFFSLLYLYAILVISLYLTYVAFHFYQQQRVQKHLEPAANELLHSAESTRFHQINQRNINDLTKQSDTNEQQQDLEGKINLLERYIEMIALDLQETNKRLREREKCDCSISCTFNGTRYADRSSWQNQCDLCTCQLGKISCLPQKCPTMNCDDAVQLPGQCCPTCMKKCKYNEKLIRHGQKFKPLDSSRKECKCNDGLIRCEQVVSTNSMQHQIIKPRQGRTNSTTPNNNNNNNNNYNYNNNVVRSHLLNYTTGTH